MDKNDTNGIVHTKRKKVNWIAKLDIYALQAAVTTARIDIYALQAAVTTARLDIYALQAAVTGFATDKNVIKCSRLNDDKSIRMQLQEIFKCVLALL